MLPQIHFFPEGRSGGAEEQLWRKIIFLFCSVITVFMLCMIFTPHHRPKSDTRGTELGHSNPLNLEAYTSMTLELDIP